MDNLKVQEVENNILNGNWTTAIAIMIKTNGLKIAMLDIPNEDKIILADYIIEELKHG